jgi:Uma2 family endonuclease
MTKKKQVARESSNSNESYFPDNVLDEIIEGIRYEMKPSPVIIHQIVVNNILDELRSSCKPNGVSITGPVDVYFDKDNRFIPDVVFISNENLDIIKPKRIEGAPDLIVEVLSPSTSKNDRQRKMAVYERYGVKEYWIADTYHYTVEQFVHKEGRYLLNQTYSFGDKLTSPIISCINVILDHIFEDARQFQERFSSLRDK